VFVAIEEAVDMAKTAEDVEFVDGDGLESDAVEDECADSADVVPRILDVGVLQDNRDEGVGEDPAVQGPVGNVWYGILFQMDGDVGIEMLWMNAKYFVEPVEKRPLGACLSPPGGLHGVLGIAFSTHDGRIVVNSSSTIFLSFFLSSNQNPKPQSVRGVGGWI
jgi:hypothetical protein